MTRFRMNARRREHFSAWARGVRETAVANIAGLEGRAFHLWHGTAEDRQYSDRHHRLADFDPYTDIALDPVGVWRWASDKPELHRLVRDYFWSRREDG